MERKRYTGELVACKAGVFCSANENTNVFPPSRTLKLTESWGESKNDCNAAHPSSLSFSIAFKMAAAINVSLNFRLKVLFQNLDVRSFFVLHRDVFVSLCAT